MPRRWSEADEDLLRDLVGKRVKARKVARLLGRSERQVRWKKARMGLSLRGHSKVTKSLVAKYNDLGMNDTAIAQKLGVSQKTVWIYRRQMGLPVRPPRGDRIRRALLAHLNREGIRYVAQNFHAEGMIEARRRGWPAGVTPAMADVLDEVRRGGCEGVRGLAARLGKSYDATVAMVTKLARGGALLRGKRRGHYTIPDPIPEVFGEPPP